MTCTNAASAEGSVVDDGPVSARKATLFCPECDFQAPLEGAWHVRGGPVFRVVRCPRCRTRVA